MNENAVDPEAVAAFGRTGSPEHLERLLDQLDAAPTEAHAEVYELIHTELRRLLDQDPSSVPQGLLNSLSASDRQDDDDEAESEDPELENPEVEDAASEEESSGPKSELE